MKQSVAFLLGALLVLGVTPLGSFADETGHAGAGPVTMTGEIVDLQCYLQHPDAALGMEHAKCARACMAKGLPIGFRSDDGNVYNLIGAGHDPIVALVADWAGKHCAVTGAVVEHDGIRAIRLASIAGAGTAATDDASAWYTCAMHPEVRQHEPGKCPKCGMTLELEKKK